MLRKNAKKKITSLLSDCVCLKVKYSRRWRDYSDAFLLFQYTRMRNWKKMNLSVAKEVVIQQRAGEYATKDFQKGIPKKAKLAGRSGGK
jgi:hypothetical protein